jgi:hypothetical protein
VGAVSERFDFLANGADLLFGGLRLHDDEHMGTPKVISLASGAAKGKQSRLARVGGLPVVKLKITLYCTILTYATGR